MELGLIARIGIVALSVMLLYFTGVPIGVLIIFSLMMLLFILLRGRIYKRVEGTLNRSFPFIAKWPPLAKKILVILVFILVYLIFKQTVYEILKLIGIDMQRMLFEGLNQTANIGE